MAGIPDPKSNIDNTHATHARPLRNEIINSFIKTSPPTPRIPADFHPDGGFEPPPAGEGQGTTRALARRLAFRPGDLHSDIPPHPCPAHSSGAFLRRGRRRMHAVARALPMRNRRHGPILRAVRARARRMKKRVRFHTFTPHAPRTPRRMRPCPQEKADEKAPASTTPNWRGTPPCGRPTPLE